MDAQRRGQLASALEAVHARIATALASCDRVEPPTLIVVTKYFPGTDVEILYDLGVRDIGESRDQEARLKVADLDFRDDLRVHFIGQVQTNKAASVVRYADVIHAVDRPKLVSALARAAHSRPQPVDVLVQVDLETRPGRGGVVPDHAARLADAIAETAELRLRGVMAVAPLGSDPEPAFATLAEVATRISAHHPEATWISAGMSTDLEVAVRYGATHLRVGGAILGSRPPRR